MKHLLFLLFSLVALPLHANNSNIPPVAVLSSNPDGTSFYNAENVVFDYYESYDEDQYINGTRWYINNVRLYSSDNDYTLSECFVLYGNPQNGCYELAQGVTTVSIKLGVRDVVGEWDYETKTYTIKEHKGRKYFIKDHLGSVRTTVNRDGNVLDFDDYYPFGLVMPGRSSNSANPNDNYKFTGHERDTEADLTLDYMMARNYDPVLGRFLQIDPHYFNYSGISPYTYVGNNPLVLVDPTGKDWYDINGEIKWHDNEGDLTLEIDGEDQTFSSLGKNVLVSYHARNEDGSEDVNGALHVLYLESNTEGATASIEGGTVPAAIETMNTLAEGLYPAREQARSSKPGELALIINEGKNVPTTTGSTMNEVFFHRGNMGRNSLTTTGGSPISAGCITGPSCAGSLERFNAFMEHVKGFSGNFYLRSQKDKQTGIVHFSVKMNVAVADKTRRN